MTRKLDALVAEKVMGWQYRQDAPGNYLCPEFGNNAGWWQEPGGDWLCANCMEEIFPDYSTDIAAAWMVVEKLVSTGAEGWESQQFSLTLEADAECGDQYWDCWISKGPKRKAAWGMSSFVPMAICLAALKAVGVEQAVIDEALK